MKKIIRKIKAKHVVKVYEIIAAILTTVGLLFAFGSEFEFKSIEGTLVSLGIFIISLLVMWAGLAMFGEVQAWEEKHNK